MTSLSIEKMQPIGKPKYKIIVGERDFDKLVEKWIEWNQRRKEAGDFCYEFYKVFKPHLTKLWRAQH